MKPPSHKRIEPSSLCIKKSTLPGAGKGLFTRTGHAKGDFIIEYKGNIVPFKTIVDSKVFNPYVYYVNRNHVIDAMPFPDSPARYANDAEGPARMPGIANNARFTVINKKVFIEATTSILPGAEILTPYGKSYWESIAFNAAVKKSYGKAVTKKK